MDDDMTIGAVAERSGIAQSALRFYEAEGLIAATRNDSGHRRFHREVLRRIAFIRVAQQVGLTLDEVRSALAALPGERTPNKSDWEKLSNGWRPRIDEQIEQLQRMRDRLTGCIGCGCLSLHACRLLNPDDVAAAQGPGPRYVIDPD